MESQEKSEPRGSGTVGHGAGLQRPEIDKTMSSRIVLVLRGLVFAARARIALRWLCCALALMLFAAGCGRRSAARLPAPPARIGSTESGLASWYGVPYHGRPSASGEIFDMEKLTAAHRALPFQTWVEVTNLSNGKQVDVRITDRGPFVRGRIIDLSMAAARQLDMVRAGTARVRLKVIMSPVNQPPVNQLPANQTPVKALEDRPTTPATGYAVQAGAFSDPARAEALREALPYSDVRVVERPGDRSLWRVLVGHALTVQAATALAADIEKAAGEAIVVKEDAKQ
jgi:peptidoglycan lytic transglycosylase